MKGDIDGPVSNCNVVVPHIQSIPHVKTGEERIRVYYPGLEYQNVSNSVSRHLLTTSKREIKSKIHYVGGRDEELEHK